MAIFALATLPTMTPAHAQAPPDRPSAPTTSPPKTTPAKQAKATPIPATTDEAMRDMEKTFGFVPQFIRAAPDALIVGFWASLKNLQMNPDTALDGKTKELIGLAVAAQIPCEYCVYFHTIAARQNGATEQEVKEALGMAAVTRMASTILNGSQLDRMAFRKEADRILKGDATKTQARPSPTRTR
jgi:AhpD family alkylhydroperoxidase